LLRSVNWSLKVFSSVANFLRSCCREVSSSNTRDSCWERVRVVCC
jgi:hypothetical protein